MSSEHSAIAKQLENYFEVKNPQVEDLKLEEPKTSLIKQVLVVLLMSLAVCLTKCTLWVTRLIKRLES